jgi:predicted GNAT family acetyltransferase
MSEVEHRPDQDRFELREDGATGVLTYDRDERSVRFLHTVVPPEIEGRGIGSRLTETAVAWAREQDLAVIPVCPFVRTWLEQHPDA